MDTIEHFSRVDFSPGKLCIATKSSFLQTSFEDLNVENDAYTHPAKDDPKFENNALSGL